MSSETSWRALTLDFDETSNSEIIYIINDYEKFYRDPMHNGVYKKVSKELLERNWIDRSDLLFWWRRQYFYQNLLLEEPLYGSHSETFGQLAECIRTLKDNLPNSIPDLYVYPYPPTPTIPPAPTTVKKITTELSWVALTLNFDTSSDTEIIFIINDYERFFRDPLNNGIYKTVSRELLEKNWIDRSDLMFWWKRQYFEDGSVDEAPIMGSHKEIFGQLKTLSDTLKDNIP